MERKTWEYLFLAAERLKDHALNQESLRDLAFFHQLSGNQARLLKTLLELTRQQPGGVSLKTLAGKLAVTPAATSEMVETLVKKGILVRWPNPEDRRSILIDFAPEARQNLDKVGCFLDQVSEEVLQTFSCEERQLFRNMLRQFHERLPDMVPHV